MRKFLFVAGTVTLLASCGGGDSKPAEKKEGATSGGNLSDNPVYQKGLALAGQSGCLNCHDVANKISGPSYQEVAEKYQGSDTAVSYLTKKILSGGTGVWGEVPMPPQPVTPEDAEAIVKYVLLLKK